MDIRHFDSYYLCTLGSNKLQGWVDDSSFTDLYNYAWGRGQFRALIAAYLYHFQELFAHLRMGTDTFGRYILVYSIRHTNTIG